MYCYQLGQLNVTLQFVIPSSLFYEQLGQQLVSCNSFLCPAFSVIRLRFRVLKILLQRLHYKNVSKIKYRLVLPKPHHGTIGRR